MELSRGRRIGIWSLLVAGTIAAVLAIFAVWTARQLLDEDNFEQTTTELIADPAIQTAIATFVVDQLYENVDLPAELQRVLPPRLDALAAPAAGALHDPLTRAVERLLRGPRVQALWADAVRITHQQFVNLVEERGKALRTPEGGGVVLDLRPLVGAIGQRLGLPITGERLPESARIVILTPDQLTALQRTVKLLKVLAIGLFLLAVALMGVAVWLARGRRRETLVTAALAVVVGAIVVLLLRRVVGGTVVDHLAKTATVQDAADAAWTLGTSLLAQIAKTAILLAGLLALTAWLAGPAGWARKVRGWARPALVQRPELVHGVVLVVLLGGLTIGVIPGIRTLAAAILLIAIAIAGVEMVRRQAMADAAV